MSVEKSHTKSIFQRLKQLVLGKERPNAVTRISVWAGFLIWIYLISWHVLTLLSIFLMGSLKQADLVKSAFLRVGRKLYDYPDTIQVLTVHAFLQLFAYLLILFSLILIWRKKRIGFLLYIISNALVIMITMFVLGWEYFTTEVPITDFLLIGISSAYFGIGALWLYKFKKQENTEPPAE